MTLQQFLLSFTFVFGVISLITRTKLFDQWIKWIINTIYWKQENKFFQWLDLMIFIFSLIYQSWYWLFKNI